MFIGSFMDQCLEDTRRLSKKAFCKKHTLNYLLGVISEDAQNGELDLNTGVIWIDDHSNEAAHLPSPKRAAAKPGKFLIKIEKKPGNVWQNWYSVGRAKNNDIVVRDPSISKLHARLDNQGPIGTQLNSNTGFWITDVGSSEGTMVNGTPLGESERYPLQIGDTISFGTVETRLLDADMLYDVLSAQ